MSGGKNRLLGVLRALPAALVLLTGAGVIAAERGEGWRIGLRQLSISMPRSRPKRVPLPTSARRATAPGWSLWHCRVQLFDASGGDRKSTRLNSSHRSLSRMPSSA